jgi:uncharacterized protein (DUF2062 family)
MKAYRLTTSLTFALLPLAHLLRAIAAGVQVIFQPFFALSTRVAAVLCLWGLVLLRFFPQGMNGWKIA